jgi:hypothetical protein
MGDRPFSTRILAFSRKKTVSQCKSPFPLFFKEGFEILEREKSPFEKGGI